MNFRPINLKRLLFLTGMAAVFSAQAQTLMRPGHSIIFSATSDDNAAADAQAPAAQPPAAPGFADMVRAPDFSFKPPAPTNPRPPERPAAPPTPTQNPRANWAFMTPAEILGLSTPENILKIPERDAAGRRKNPTAMERFYERENQAQTNGASGLLPGSPSLRGGFLDNDDARLNANDVNQSHEDFGGQRQTADSLQKPTPFDGLSPNQNRDAGWSKNFPLPTTPAQSPAQAADMAEFRKLLEPSQPSKSSRPSSGDGLFYSPPQTVTHSTFNPQVSPGSVPFDSYNGGIGGLPGVAGQAVMPTMTAAPEWKPQPAPWTSKGPQPETAPKRKF